MEMFKTKKMILAVITALVLLSTLPFLQSCSNEETPLASQQEYLDLDVSNIQNFTEEQKQILKTARERIDSYVVCENKTYTLTLNKGSEIQISERLFDYFKATIEKTNKIINGLNLVVDVNNPKLLHVVKRIGLKTNVRFKVIAEVPNSGESGADWSWDHVDIYLNSLDTKTMTDCLTGSRDGAALAAIYSGYLGQAGVCATASLTTWILDKGIDGLKDSTGTGGAIITVSLLGGISATSR